MRPLSKDWTAEDRLRVVAAMLPGILEGIHKGEYFSSRRPNITSVQHIIYESAATLESYRDVCEAAVMAHEKQSVELEKGLWPT